MIVSCFVKRRRAIQALAAAPAAAQEVVSTGAEAVASPALSFFNASEMEALYDLCKLILPALGGRPGAIEAGVPQFLDFLLSKSSKADQRLYRAGMAAWANTSRRTQLLKQFEQAWTYDTPADSALIFPRRLKDDVLRATFNSREWLSGRRGGGTGYYWKPFD